MNKLSQTKNNQTKGSRNILACNCQISHTSLATSQAIAIAIKSNTKAYISKNYLQHEIFATNNLTQTTKIDLLTLVVLGATITNTTNNQKLSTASNCQPLYKVYYKDLIIDLNGNDSQAKKYFNILKNYKHLINIQYYNIATSQYVSIVYAKTSQANGKTIYYYPPYLKKLNEYRYHIGYNPDSKKTIVKIW